MSCCGGRRSKRKVRANPRFRHLKPKGDLSALSATPPLKTIAVCRPTFYSINYQINPWMSISNQVAKNTCVEQWSNLTDRLEEFGAEVIQIKPRQELPDMVFTANAGLVLKDRNTVVLSNFKHPERAPEQWWFREFFVERGTQVLIPISDFEGAGDALFMGDQLIGAYGFRSDIEAYIEINPLLNKETKVVKLVDARFYHLDTCFCPLSDQHYMIYPKAFDAEGLAAIRSLGWTEIEVPDEDAKSFACNAVQVGKHVLIPTGSDQTAEALAKAGFVPTMAPMTEFIKAGGACKCLTLEI